MDRTPESSGRFGPRLTSAARPRDHGLQEAATALEGGPAPNELREARGVCVAHPLNEMEIRVTKAALQSGMGTSGGGATTRMPRDAVETRFSK
jgi:hypothetical protein